MKRLTLLLVLIYSLAALSSEGIRTREDFSPPPPSEKPLTDYLPDHFSSNTGLWVSTAGTLGLMGLSLFTAHNTVDQGLSNPEGREMQNGIILTGTCLIGTALFAVLVDYFLNEEE